MLDHMRHYYKKLYHDINFRPMIVTWNCHKEGCSEQYKRQNCVSDGKYCAVESKPDKVGAANSVYMNPFSTDYIKYEIQNKNLNGVDIILEDLRQYCMWDTFVMSYEKGIGTLFNYIH